jgi:hypothetical protein
MGVGVGGYISRRECHAEIGVLKYILYFCSLILFTLGDDLRVDRLWFRAHRCLRRDGSDGAGLVIASAVKHEKKPNI